MSEQAQALIDAIAAENSAASQTAFETAIGAKLAERFDALRTTLSKGMFNPKQAEE